MPNPRNTTRPSPRTTARLVATVGATAVAAALTLTACSTDRVSSPDLAATAPSLAKAGKADKKVARPAHGSAAIQSLAFVYDPTKQSVQTFGSADKVTIPAGAVCDPATSGYGVDLWDKACKPLATPITFTLTWTEDAIGHTIVEFSPDVRFVPGSQVILDITDKILPKNQEKGAIFWCPTGGDSCYDESTNDPSVQTTTHGTSSHLVRRLKHFSGYTVVFGADDGSSDGQ